MNEFASFAHRSVSVREHLHQPLPQLRRSASTSGNKPSAGPVEIGTKGSIFALVGRDIIGASSSDSTAGSSRKKALNSSIWHRRLWRLPKRADGNHKQEEATRAKAVTEGRERPKIRKWKMVLKVLKWARYGGDGSLNAKDNVLHHPDKRKDVTSPPLPPLQRSKTPTSPIWERRNFAQITPLDFSHLRTARIKKELGRPCPKQGGAKLLL